MNKKTKTIAKKESAPLRRVPPKEPKYVTEAKAAYKIWCDKQLKIDETRSKPNWTVIVSQDGSPVPTPMEIVLLSKQARNYLFNVLVPQK